MTVVRGQFDKFLRPGARKVFIDDYPELPAFYSKVMNVSTSNKAFEDDLVATGLPIAVTKPEGVAIYFDRPKYRGRVRYIHAGYGLGYEITRETVEDNLYQPLTSQGSANLARSMREAEETTAANVFNLGFTTVQAYDGVSLLNDSHPVVGGGTLANRPAADEDISTSALKACTERFFALTTDRGLKIQMAPSMVVVSNSNWWTLNEILGTRMITGAATGGEIDTIISTYAHNVVTDMGLTPARWAYLTDADAWFAMVPKAQHRLNFFWRRKPDFVSGTDERTGIAWFGVSGRWVAGATDWRGIDGSTGA